MESRSIVALEIASSKVKGAVALSSGDGSLEVLAVESVPIVDSVRHGRVHNIREVSAAVNDVIHRLEADPRVAPRRIENVVVAMGGRSLSASQVTASMSFPHEIEITEKTINRLKAEATKDFAGNKNIEAIVPRMFWVNNMLMRPVVGTIGTGIKGEFMLLTCAKETRTNLERLKFDSIRAGSVSYQLRATAEADFLLTDDQRQIGCAQVDFGAETCTVSVYKGGALAFLSTLPMGSRLITKDLINGLKLSENTAEDFKIRLGNLEKVDRDAPNAVEINNYVHARAGEIAANIVAQIERAGVAPDQLAAGIILTGGGASLPGFARMLAGQSKMEVKIAGIPDFVTFADARYADPANIDVLAIAYEGLSTTDSEGLTPAPAPQPAQAPAFSIDSDNDATEAEIRGSKPAPATRTAREQPAPRRHAVHDDLDEDDPNLLTDDDDEPSGKGRRPSDHSRFMPQPQPEEDEEEEEYEDEEEVEDPYGYEDEEEPEEPKSKLPKNPKKKSIFDSLFKRAEDMRNAMAEIFAPRPREEDDENEDDR